MKKLLLFATAVLFTILSSTQNTWAKCETVINIPTTICVGEKYDLSINDAPCDCIKYADVEWFITDPGGITAAGIGSPFSYVFSMVGTYKVCVKWADICTGETFFECRDVVVTDCKCKPKIDIPTTICAGEKYNLSINDDPCDCIKYSEVEWIITTPGGISTTYMGSPLSYVFSTPGTYTVCIKWYDYCTGETHYECHDVIVKDCCKTKIDIPTTICAGEKYNLSVNDDPCDCIKYADVEWIITDPGGAIAVYMGSPLSFVFSMVGTYKVCVKWFDICTGKDNFDCQDVIVTNCCKTKIDIPTTLCSGEKYNLSISDAPCDCIKYDEVEWVITDPGGISTTYWGSPLSYVFSTPGTYKVCIKWHDYCLDKTFSECHDVIVKDCKCETIINIPTTICAGEKYNLSISDAPCDCIKYADVEWIITDPGGSTTIYTGSPLSYVFATAGTYTVCIKWVDICTGKDNYECHNVVVTSCCFCDMKISENTSTTDFAGGAIINAFHINSGSKKVVGMELSVPYWNYDWAASGCKFNCDELSTGFPLGNIIKYSDINSYFPTPTGCFDDWYAREVDWTFPTPQVIDQDFKFIISIPHTDCKIDYHYCVKVLLHYDDCTVCECTFCFKGNDIVCSCAPVGKAAAKVGKTGGLNAENVNVFPNPNDGTFTIQMQPTNSTKVISIMDMTGKTVLKSVVSGEKANVELNNVAAGTYIVVVTGDGKSVSKRVVIANTK